MSVDIDRFLPAVAFKLDRAYLTGFLLISLNCEGYLEGYLMLKHLLRKKATPHTYFCVQAASCAFFEARCQNSALCDPAAQVIFVTHASP